MNPPLTTREEPLKDMAEQAVTLLDLRTRGEKVRERNLMMPVRLIDRNSV